MDYNIKYNWEEYQADFKELVYKIKDSGKKYERIVAIHRGGLILGTHLSNVLDVPLGVLLWSRKLVRDSSNQTIIMNRGKNILLVDDILDSGDTIHDVQQTYKEYNMDTAVLIYNNINKFNITPTYFGWEINRNDTPQWFDFWWEKV